MNEAFEDLLVEVGTEELPPKALEGLSEALAAGFGARLAGRGISFGEVETYASPRRLGLLVRQVASRQPDQETCRRGPAVSASFGSDGGPTRAAEGFARSCGVGVDELEREVSEKGEWLLFRSRSVGAETVALIPELLEQTLAGLPIPKRMRWGEGDAEFVRPVHWVCLIYGDHAIEGRVLGVPTGPETRGHRFHHPDPIRLQRAGQYADRLREEGRVEPSFERRRQMILGQVSTRCAAEGVIPQVDGELLDEVTALVEWPSPIWGRFDESFLAVPPEVLIETMQKHQRYFPVRRDNGSLDNSFVAIANIDSRDPDEVRAGNERVIRPRFSDARFFWEQDLSRPLESLFPKLESVVFQDRLGSLADKTRRVAGLSKLLAPATGVSPELVERAALLSKCDLVSTMVYEFPSLQGTMGQYYARQGGEDACVVAAMEEQYRPRFSGDSLADSDCGLVLGLADRLDSLVGIFGVGERPTGTKDPYGLRRASIAVLRILIETPLDLDLRKALEDAASGFTGAVLEAGTVEVVLRYMFDRLPGYYQEQGIPEDRVEAVLATGDTMPSRIDQRVRAVHRFSDLPAANALAAANKRIRNLLIKAMAEGEGLDEPQPTLFESDSEHRLWRRVQELSAEVGPLLERQDFSTTLDRLAALRVHVDQLFEDVMVMVEDPAVRLNRLSLLAQVLSLFRKVADISYLH
jgi:glycyl-tRNA synthetase beta chain